MKRLAWLLLIASAFAQTPAESYSAEGPPSPGTAQKIGAHYVDIKNAQLYVCTSTSYANKATTCNWTAVGSTPGAVVQVSTQCGNSANCFKVKGDVQFVSDAAWTNLGTTITTSATDPVFTSADVGKIEFGTSNCNSGNGNIDCHLQVPQGTIVSVTDSHHAVVSLAATATAAGVAWFAWGSDDTVPMQNAMAAINTPQAGGDLTLPCNAMFVSAAPFIVNVGHFYPVNIKGCGGTQIIPLPNFNQTSCKAFGNSTTLTGCIFSDWESQCYPGSCNHAPQPPYVYDHLSDFQVWGLGQDATGVSSRYTAITGGNLYIENVQVVGWQWAQTLGTNNNCAFDVSSSTLINDIGWTVPCGLAVEGQNVTLQPTVVYAGQYGISQNGPGMIIIANNPNNGNDYTITNGVTFSAAYGNVQLTNTAQAGVVVNNSLATWVSTDDYSGGVTMTAGNAIISGLYDNFLSHKTLFTASGTTTTLLNSFLPEAFEGAGSTIIDQGGNTVGTYLAQQATVIGSSVTSTLALPKVPAYAGNNAFIQGTGASLSSNATTAMPFTTVTGNAIIAWVSTVNAGAIDFTGCTDTAGDTFTQAVAHGANSANQIAIYVAPNITTRSSNIVTCTTTAGHTFFNVYAEEWSGIKTATPIDGAGANNSAAAATSITTNLTTTVPGELIVSGMDTSSSPGTVSVGSGFLTYPFNNTTNPIRIMGAQSQVTTGVGVYAVANSWTSSTNFQLVAIGLLPATGTQNVKTLPNLSGTYNIPDTSAWKNGIFTGILSTSKGGNISSATAITPVAQVSHVTGTTTITTITPPFIGFTGCIQLVPDGLWSTNTGGNIALATTGVVSKALTECYDGTSWYPSY